MKLALTIAVAALALTSAPVFAGGHGGNPAVKARQSHMQLYQFNAGYFFGMARGNVEYDAETAQAAADNLVALTRMNQGRMWPQGSDSDAIEGTRALPALWQDFPKVMEIGGSLAAAAEAMQAVAGNGQEAAMGALNDIGKACTACHEAFRAPQ